MNIVDNKGHKTTYTILGPWDADPEQNILSFNSKLAQAMIGKKEGENFNFRDDEFQIISLGNYLKQ